MKWIIIDLKTRRALYGVLGKTLKFSTKEIAEEVASQFFEKAETYMVVQISL